MAAKKGGKADEPFDDKQAKFYALFCPESGDIRYIGKAMNPERRFKQHLSCANRKYPVYAWIASLRARGLSPGMFVMRSGEGRWQDQETALIASYRAAGCKMLNVANGGDQPACSRETRAANGRKNARAVHDDPFKRRVWELNRKIGELLRAGAVRPEAKEKLRRAAQLRPDLFGRWANV